MKKTVAYTAVILSFLTVACQTEYTRPAREQLSIFYQDEWNINSAPVSSNIEQLSYYYDKTPPANVAQIKAICGSDSVILNWKNPCNDDYLCMEVSMEPAEGLLSEPVYVDPTRTSLEVTGLKPDTEYKFTLRSIDTGLNYSSGLSKSIVCSKSFSDYTQSIPTASAKIEKGNIKLTWKNPTDYSSWGTEIIVKEQDKSYRYIAKRSANRLTIKGLSDAKNCTIILRPINFSIKYGNELTICPKA